MIGRVGVSIPENWYLLDLDGKTWMPSDKDTAVEIHQFQACGGMTAQETFETYGKGETPDRCMCGTGNSAKYSTGRKIYVCISEKEQ
ncbi:MAG: hypothetical protein ACLRIT_04490 [Blautia sp.]